VSIEDTSPAVIHATVLLALETPMIP